MDGRVFGNRKMRADFNNIATRMVVGEQAAYTGNALTGFHEEVELQQHFDAVRVLFGVGPGNDLSIAGANLLTVSSLADSPSSFNGPINLTFSGSATATITAPAGSKRQALLWSDWAFISSIVRDDAGTKPILIIRSQANAAASLALNGPSVSFDTWATTATDGRYYRRRRSTTSGLSSSQSNWHTQAVSNFSPVVAIQYVCRGRVVTIAANGDSTAEGSSGTRIGASYMTPLANALAASSGFPVEVVNLGWNGTTMAEIAKRAVDFAPFLKLPFVIEQIGSWNGVAGSFGGAPTNLTANDIGLSRRGFAEAQAAWAGAGTFVIPRAWIPINASAVTSKQPGASDSLRRAYNAAVQAECLIYADANTPISGGLDGNGQETIAAGQTTDGLHPSDTGYATLAAGLLLPVQSSLGL